MSEQLITRFLEKIQVLERVVARQEVRINNMFREGTVKEVDYAKGVAIVDAHGVESKEVPWMEPAGDIVEWTPPSIGQRVMLVSPGGQPGRGFLIPGGFTDSVPQPHNVGAEKRIKIGGAQLTFSGSTLLVEIGGSTLNFSAEGLTVTAGGTTFQLTGAGFVQTGGKQEHDGKDVGATHTNGMLPVD